MRNSNVIGAALICSLLAAPAEAEVRRLCKVSYQQANFLWSEGALVEVTFLTGQELHAATRSTRYSPFAYYAMIWFDKGEVAILRYAGVLTGVGHEFTGEDFKRMFRAWPEAQFDQENGPPLPRQRRWKLIAKESLRFFDPRANQE